jgi:hypothetical protein
VEGTGRGRFRKMGSIKNGQKAWTLAKQMHLKQSSIWDRELPVYLIYIVAGVNVIDALGQ